MRNSLIERLKVFLLNTTPTGSTTRTITSADRGYTHSTLRIRRRRCLLQLSRVLSHNTWQPTSFAVAIVISSPFFLSQPFTNFKLQSFSTAFRHATHLKYRTVIDDAKSQSTLASILGRSKESSFAQWVIGVQGGPASSTSGLWKFNFGCGRGEKEEGILVQEVNRLLRESKNNGSENSSLRDKVYMYP